VTGREFFGTGACAAALIAVLSACVTTAPVPTIEPLADADAIARLKRDAAGRARADTVIKAALPGLEGVVVNATVDVACEAPKKLSVSVRSFFEVPQQVLVADGGVVTLYDATSGAPRFAQGPANDKSLQRVLGLPLAPDDAVALLLGRAPLEPDKPGYLAPRVRVFAMDAVARTYTVAIERVGRGALRWTARIDDDAVVAVSAFTGDGRHLLDATLAEHASHAGVLFARRVTVTTATGAVVVLTVQQGRYNGEPLAPEAFTLALPPGVAVEKL